MMRVGREIKFLKVLRHPNVVQLYEIIETREEFYLIMEYAAHGELFDYIVRHGRVDETTALKFFRQIVSGISYIHSQGIIHRDLKPENLLLDSHDNIKIVDFGLSNDMASNGLLKTACGSPCYAPPEMILGRKYKGAAADIWSCGVILFALLCGYLPFDNPNTSKLYRDITTANYVLPNNISDGAKDLVRKILVVDPLRRYTINSIRRHPWFQGSSSYSLVHGISVNAEEMQADAEVIELMQESGLICNKEQTIDFVKRNRHNGVTATYYLIKNGTRKTFRENSGALDGLNASFELEQTEFYRAKMGRGIPRSKTRNKLEKKVERMPSVSAAKPKTAQPMRKRNIQLATMSLVKDAAVVMTPPSHKAGLLAGGKLLNSVENKGKQSSRKTNWKKYETTKTTHNEKLLGKEVVRVISARNSTADSKTRTEGR
eukprot:TRINITY_DN7509_c0_g2_i8.p1 TRINITY_DN7509_c0_g2~~TRINITY_DN7509_c0_g2_i8.p1  ORF type:complete len:431 (-),score=83.95 TRINITY_DN7509_c0_g2_i8:550-1842(-)